MARTAIGSKARWAPQSEGV